MDDLDRVQLLHNLEGRKDLIVEAWYKAVSSISFVPFTAAEVRQRLAELTSRASSLLVAESFEPHKAQAIGADFARLHYLLPEAFGATLSILAKELLHGLSADQTLALQPNLATLLGGMAAGFQEQSTQIQMAEQESARRALVGQLLATEKALRQAGAELERRVEERTRELRASEDRYRELLENVDAVIASIDQDGVLSYLSPAVTRWLDRPLSELVGHPFLEFVHPEDVPVLLKQFAQASPGQSSVAEFRFVTGSGEVRWARAVSRAVVADRHMLAAHAVLTDITERRRTEQALQEAEERWRSLVESAPDLVGTVDPLGRFVFINRMPPESGLTVQGMLGKYACDFPLPEYRETVKAAIEHVFSTGTGIEFEFALRRPNGAMVWYAGHIGPLRQLDRVTGAMLILRDISERKRIDQLRDNLAQDVSHELRAPLARAQMGLELLLAQVEVDPIDRRDVVKAVRMALANVQRLVRTAEAILTLTTLEAGARPFGSEPIDLRNLIGAAVLDMTPLALAKGLTLEANLPDSLPTVQGDREKLHRVLNNLIDNAVKFTPKGQIVVSAQDKGGYVQVEISDPGRGLLPESLESVFDRFYKEEGHFAGAGVGLAICKAIVDGHGGRIWAESPGRDKGATFRFTLPAMGDRLG